MKAKTCRTVLKKITKFKIIIWKNIKNMNGKVFCGMNNNYLEWNCIIWNEIEKHFELKAIKRNVPGMSLWGMSLSIEKTEALCIHDHCPTPTDQQT